MAFRKLSVAALLLLFSAVSARMVLQTGRPTQCDAGTGKWADDNINCDFTCPSGGWELDCETDKGNGVQCKVDQDGAPDSQDIKFKCTFAAPGQVRILFLNYLIRCFLLLASLNLS